MTEAAAAGPMKRSPVMILAITYGGFVGASILGQILVSATGVGMLATACSAGAYGVFMVIMMAMVADLNRVTKAELAAWMVAVPLLNIWFLAVKIHGVITAAKQKAGVQTPTRPQWMYVLLAPYAFASDLNDLV